MDDATAPVRVRWAARHPQLVGVLLLLALHATFILAPWSLGAPAEWAGLKPEAGTLLIGVVQLFYVIPVTLLALKMSYPAVAMGIVKGAVVTLVVNLAGCAVFVWQLSKIG